MRAARLLLWRDRRHWSLVIRRVYIERWCPGAPCARGGDARSTHWVRVWWSS